MPTLVQAHGIVSRKGWLSLTPAPFRQTVLEHCKLEALKGGATIYSVGDPPGGMLDWSAAVSLYQSPRASAGLTWPTSRGPARGLAKRRRSPSSRGGSGSRSHGIRSCCICHWPPSGKS